MTKPKNPTDALISDIKKIRGQVAAARDRLFALHTSADMVVEDLDAALTKLDKYKRTK